MVKIIVEGDNDKNFFISLLNYLVRKKELEKKDYKSFFRVMGGKGKLLDSSHNQYKKLTPQIEAGKIKKLLFIFDCDFEEDDKNISGMNNSKKCFEKLLSKFDWNIEVESHIFDKNLDYFLMETIKNKACYKEFSDLVDCLNVNSIKKNKKPMANLYRDLYPYPEFDFENEKFSGLKSKLIKLFS